MSDDALRGFMLVFLFIEDLKVFTSAPVSAPVQSVSFQVGLLVAYGHLLKHDLGFMIDISERLFGTEANRQAAGDAVFS